MKLNIGRCLASMCGTEKSSCNRKHKYWHDLQRNDHSKS